MNKILICCSLFAIMTITNVYAGTGKGVIPQIITDTSANLVTTTAVVSNITSHNLIVSFDVINGCFPSDQISYSSPFINITATNAELPANSSGTVVFINRDCISPASIVWNNKSGENDLYGLVATAHIQARGSTSKWIIPMVVNNNIPF